MYEAISRAQDGKGGHNNMGKIGGMLKGAWKALKSGDVGDAADQVADMAKDIVAGIRGGSQSPVISCNEEVDLYEMLLSI